MQKGIQDPVKLVSVRARRSFPIFPFTKVVNTIENKVQAENAPANKQIKKIIVAAPVLRNVSGITGLMGVMTVLARMPRLVRGWFWTPLAFCIFLVAMIGYDQLTNDLLRAKLAFLPSFFHVRASLGTIGIALTMGGVALLIGKKRPAFAMKTLLLLGACATLVIVASMLRLPHTGGSRSLWPVAFGGMAFLYLWWLATLLFDLVFVWHFYIRHSGALKFLRKHRKRVTNSKMDSGSRVKIPVPA
jgi:hypothetical protein